MPGSPAQKTENNILEVIHMIKPEEKKTPVVAAAAPAVKVEAP